MMSNRRASTSSHSSKTITRSQSQKGHQNNIGKDQSLSHSGVSQTKITEFSMASKEKHKLTDQTQTQTHDKSKSNERTPKKTTEVTTEVTAPAPDPTPATSADIMKVLQTLESMKEDNSTIKTQLSELQVTFQTKINEIDTKISKLSATTTTMIEENKSDIKSLQQTVSELEKGLNFQGEQINTQKTELEKIRKSHEAQDKQLKEHKTKEENLKKELQNMQEKQLDMERHVRKYNLLLYGVPENKGEDIHTVIKTFFKEDVKLQDELVDSMLLSNAHRLPSKGQGPKPIIVRFVRWRDRDAVLSQVFSGVLPRGKRILTDLPPVLKAERHRLMQEAYKLRNGETPLKTRVFESGNSVRLQVRKSNTEPWANYTK